MSCHPNRRSPFRSPPGSGWLSAGCDVADIPASMADPQDAPPWGAAARVPRRPGPLGCKATSQRQGSHRYQPDPERQRRFRWGEPAQNARPHQPAGRPRPRAVIANGTTGHVTQLHSPGPRATWLLWSARRTLVRAGGKRPCRPIPEKHRSAVLARRGSGALSHSVMGFAISGSRSYPPAAALAIPAPEVGGYAVAVRDGIVPPAIMKEIRRPWSCLEMLVA